MRPKPDSGAPASVGNDAADARFAARITWWRPEPFGAWLRLGEGTLVAIDRSLRARLGLDPGRSPRVPTAPLEAHVGITRRCDCRCEGCYQASGPKGLEPPFEDIVRALRQMAELGVATVAFGGGEPLLRKDIGDIARATRDLGMIPVTTTSGACLTADRVGELRDFAQINVSHDGVDGVYARSRGWDGAPGAERAIAMLSEAGIAVGANMLLARGVLDAVEPTALRVAELGAKELQLLRYKPAGRGANVYDARSLRSAEIGQLGALLRRLSASSSLSVRIDCALLPLLADVFLDEPGAVELLRRTGVFGCEAGRYLSGVSVEGALVPCSCWTAGACAGGWDDDAEMRRIRAWHAALAEPCASCGLSDICRGGCQVVSQFRSGALGPDPECPRVLRHGAADREPQAR